ncbi:hypothetical protein C1H46_033196 [Malus baccata]|uniref:Uncharacterized protein n=1 Tax=Malus baccata TaxID=106549 RepID=A0A540L472_MALBA|nr:hypothetical protein C1H46_033196 [Malus baccata]
MSRGIKDSGPRDDSSGHEILGMSLIGIKKDEPSNNGLGHEILTPTKYKSLVGTTEDFPSHESSGHEILAPTNWDYAIRAIQGWSRTWSSTSRRKLRFEYPSSVTPVSWWHMAHA